MGSIPITSAMIKLNNYSLELDEYTTVEDITKIVKNPDYKTPGHEWLSNSCHEFLEIIEPDDKIISVTWYFNPVAGAQDYYLQDKAGNLKYCIKGWIS